MNENIVKLNYQDKEIYLVKTAHVSKNSVADVTECVNEVNPDAICIELDQQRYERLKNPDKWRQTDLVKVIKDRQVGFLLINTILASFQKRMAKSLQSNSGAEMLQGMKLAQERNIQLVLADRPIKTTFSRIWNKLSAKEKIKLLSSSILSVFEDEEITEEDLEKLKEADALQAALAEISEQFPTVKKVLVDERDAYLCQKIKSANGKKIVAIIGAAHSYGISENLDKDVDIKELEKVEVKNSSKALKWILPILIIFTIIYSLLMNKNIAIENIKSWALWHGPLSAIGVLCAWGHPLSALTALVVSPITSLIPTLPSGIFAGIVEATIRKPKVKDFEDLADDTASLKGFWKNQVTRTLLVVIFANIFSSLGTLISSIDIFANFFKTF